jgi:hypothetical protein
MNAVTADAVSADVVPSQSTTSLSYTNLSTTGPEVTLTLVAGQGVLVLISARAYSTLGGASGQALFSFEVTGASTLAANDSNGVESLLISTEGVGTMRATWYVATNSGSHTFRMRYRAGTAGTASFTERRIIAKKF